MGWATHYIPRLQAGETVQFRPRGDSMSGRIESGQLCTVAPADPSTSPSATSCSARSGARSTST